MKKHSLFIIMIIGIALAIGIWRENYGTTVQEKQIATLSPLQAGTALNQSQPLPKFDFVDMEGKPFSNAQLNKHWSFLFFGYTGCPDVCPAILNTLHQISQRVGKGFNTQFVLITIDPERDNPKQLKAFLQQKKYHKTAFVGVTGEKEKIHHLAKEIGVYIAQEKNIDANDIEHGGAILLINPEGKMVAIFTRSDNPQAIVSDFKEMLHQHSRA